MNVLYEARVTYTYGEYLAYSRVIFRRRALPVLLGLEALFLLSALYTKGLLLAVVGAILLLAAVAFHNRRVKKLYTSGRLPRELEIHLRFGEEALVEETGKGPFTVPYEKLRRIIETKTHFFLMTTGSQGYILNKAALPQGLEDFLRSRKGKK